MSLATGGIGEGLPDLFAYLPAAHQRRHGPAGYSNYQAYKPWLRDEFTDERGWLYGMRPRDGAGHIPDLGTWGQQMAEIPFARPGEPWHGYPLWPLGEEGPANRRGEKGRPSKRVFLRMEEAGLITDRERKKLYKGDHL